MLIIAGVGQDLGHYDILRCPVRLTRDGVLVCVNESITGSDHLQVRRHSLEELRGIAPDAVPLEALLDTWFGQVLIDIQLKSTGSAWPLIALLNQRYIKSATDWQHCVVSSFLPRELRRARRTSPHVPLGLLQRKNPFAFIAHHRTLGLSAVGFHRLYLKPLALDIAGRIGVLRYAYTVNRPSTTARQLPQLDAIVSDIPAKLQHLRD